MKVKAKKSWLAVGAGMLAGAFALTGIALLNSEPKTALADETAKVLYYVDAGRFVSGSDGKGDLTLRGSTKAFPSVQSTKYMDAYGLEFGNGTTGLYNSVTDRPLNYDVSVEDSYLAEAATPDAGTGKYWGFTCSDAAYGWNTWRTHPTDANNNLKDGFNTARMLSENDAENATLTYKFEVDDNSPLKVVIGSRSQGGWKTPDYKLVINGTQQETPVIHTVNNVDNEYTFIGNDVVGVEENGKHYLSVTFTRPGTDTLFLNWILVTTADYSIYKIPADTLVTKDVTTVKVTPDDGGEEVEATLTSESQEALSSANYMDKVDVVATVGGQKVYGTVRVIPDHRYYFVNVAGPAVDEMLVADGLYSADTHYGYVEEGSVGHDGATFPGSEGWPEESYWSSVRQDMDKLIYRFDVAPGTYKVIVGVCEHWSQYSPTRRHLVKANGGAEIELQAPNTDRGTAHGTVEGVVTDDGILNVEISRKDNDQAMAIAYILVYSDSHIISHVAEKPATCTEAGNSEYFYCAGCDKYFTNGDATEEASAPTFTPATNHPNKQHHDATGSCTEPGTIEYWSCADCDKNFSDEDCTQVVDDLTRTVGHTIISVDAVAATCTEAGTIAHYTCTVCNQNFSDDEGTQVLDSIAGEDALGHQKVHHDAVAATCTTQGIIEYWECTRCHKNFREEACTTEITNEDDLKTEKAAHTPTQVAAVAPTCTTTGTKAHWECSVCHKKFMTQECTSEVTDADLIEAKAAHTTSKVDAVAATCETAGTIEHWTCSVCHKNFAEQAGTNELSSIVADALGHDYEFVWTWDGVEAATCTATCSHDATHTFTLTAVITSEVTKEATEDEEGEITYTATVTDTEGNTYTDTKTESIPKVEKAKKKGCKSSISASLAIVGGMLVAGAAAIAIKKRKNDK